MNTLNYLAKLSVEVEAFYEQACRGMFQAVEGKPGETQAGFEPDFELTFANGNSIYKLGRGQLLCNGTREQALKYFRAVAGENPSEEGDYALTEGKAFVTPDELLEAARALTKKIMSECPEPVRSIELSLHGGESRSGVGRYLNLTELSLHVFKYPDGTITDNSTCWRRPENSGKEIEGIAIIKGAEKTMQDLMDMVEGKVIPTDAPNIEDFIAPQRLVAEAASRLNKLGFRTCASEVGAVMFYGDPSKFKSAFGLDLENMTEIPEDIRVPDSLADIIAAIDLR